MSEAQILEMMAAKLAALSRRVAALERQDRPSGSGATTLGGLSDVTADAAPADDELLAYDTTAGQWINQTAAEAGVAAAGHNHDAAYAALAHKARHATLGADALAAGDIGAATSGHNHDATYAALANGVTDGDGHNHAFGSGGAPIPYDRVLGTPVIDGAVDVGSLRTIGTGALQAAAGNHSHSAITNSEYNSFTLADDASANLIAAGGVAYGICIIYCPSEANTAIVSIDSGSSVTLVSDPKGVFRTADTDGFHCIYQSGSDTILKNRRGGNRGYRIHRFA